MHAIDYRNATIKVEVPLENLVYIPTWDDVHKYVHFSEDNINKKASDFIHDFNHNEDHAAPAAASPSSSFDREIPLLAS